MFCASGFNPQADWALQRWLIQALLLECYQVYLHLDLLLHQYRLMRMHPGLGKDLVLFHLDLPQHLAGF